MNAFHSISLLTLATVITLNGNTAYEKPTIEQLLNTDKFIISFEFNRNLDKQNVDMDKWRRIAVTLSDLIAKCHTYPAQKNNKLIKKALQAIRLIYKEHHAQPACGISERLFMAGQTSQQEDTHAS